MKYLRYFFFALAVSAFAATSCNKEIESPEASDTPAENPQEIDLPEGFVKLSVQASPETTRTAVSDAGAVTWVAGDEVEFLWSGGNAAATAASSGASATFSAVVPDSGDLYAVYPSGAGTLADGTISMSIPSTQDGTFANGNFSAAKVNRSTSAASFQNVSAFLKFTVSNSSVRRIDVESSDNGGAHLTGDIDVTFSDYAISLSELSGGGGRVRLDIDGPGTYYIAVAPGVTHGGLSITYYTKDGDTYTSLPPYHYNKSITLERNHIKDFGDLYPNPGHLYVSVSGSGTQSGFTADNAMSFEKWKTRVERVSSDNTNANVAQRKALDGVTFHFAAGTYPFTSTSPLYVGSYTGSGVEFTISGETGAIFSGAVSGAATGSILRMGYGTLNIENIIFEYAAATANTTNGALFLNNTDAIVNLTDCTFRNNGTSSYIGGSIDIFHGKLNATNCTFSGNGGKQASCVDFNGVATDAATFTNCTFSGNTVQAIRAQGGQFTFTGCTFSDNSYSGNGAAIRIQNAEAEFSGCTFSGNNAASNTGGAIYATTGAVISIKDNSSFTGNSAKWGNCIGIDNTANLTLTGCTFNQNSNNIASAQGGALFAKADAVIDASGCVFSENSVLGSKAPGGAYYCEGNAVADFTSCVFSGNHTGASSGYNNDYGGAAFMCGSATTRFNQCRFQGNYAAQGGALYMDSSTATTYLNACVFSGNHISYRYGVIICASKTAGTFCMNNCTFADNNYGAAGSAVQLCLFNLKLASDDQVVISNTSLIADLRRNTNLSNYSDGRQGLVRLDGAAGSMSIINSIIAPTQDNANYGPSKAIQSDNSSTTTVSAVSNKMYSHNHGTYTASGENATDYKGTSSYFAGLSFTGGSSWNDTYWGWNGTLATGSNTNKATLASVNTAIQSANAGFYSWLESIGALDKDGRGKTRGSSTWPGAYDGTNN